MGGGKVSTDTDLSYWKLKDVLSEKGKAVTYHDAFSGAKIYSHGTEKCFSSVCG